MSAPPQATPTRGKLGFYEMPSDVGNIDYDKIGQLSKQEEVLEETPEPTATPSSSNPIVDILSTPMLGKPAEAVSTLTKKIADAIPDKTGLGAQVGNVAELRLGMVSELADLTGEMSSPLGVGAIVGFFALDKARKLKKIGGLFGMAKRMAEGGISLHMATELFGKDGPALVKEAKRAAETGDYYQYGKIFTRAGLEAVFGVEMARASVRGSRAAKAAGAGKGAGGREAPPGARTGPHHRVVDDLWAYEGKPFGVSRRQFGEIARASSDDLASEATKLSERVNDFNLRAHENKRIPQAKAELESRIQAKEVELAEARSGAEAKPKDIEKLEKDLADTRKRLSDLGKRQAENKQAISSVLGENVPGRLRAVRAHLEGRTAPRAAPGAALEAPRRELGPATEPLRPAPPTTEVPAASAPPIPRAPAALPPGPETPLPTRAQADPQYARAVEWAAERGNLFSGDDMARALGLDAATTDRMMGRLIADGLIAERRYAEMTQTPTGPTMFRSTERAGEVARTMGEGGTLVRGDVGFDAGTYRAAQNWVNENPKFSPKVMSDVLGVDEATAGRIIKRMEADGLIRPEAEVFSPAGERVSADYGPTQRLRQLVESRRRGEPIEESGSIARLGSNEPPAVGYWPEGPLPLHRPQTTISRAAPPATPTRTTGVARVRPAPPTAGPPQPTPPATPAPPPGAQPTRRTTAPPPTEPPAARPVGSESTNRSVDISEAVEGAISRSELVPGNYVSVAKIKADPSVQALNPSKAELDAVMVDLVKKGRLAPSQYDGPVRKGKSALEPTRAVEVVNDPSRPMNRDGIYNAFARTPKQGGKEVVQPVATAPATAGVPPEPAGGRTPPPGVAPKKGPKPGETQRSAPPPPKAAPAPNAPDLDVSIGEAFTRLKGQRKAPTPEALFRSKEVRAALEGLPEAEARVVFDRELGAMDRAGIVRVAGEKFRGPSMAKWRRMDKDTIVSEYVGEHPVPLEVVRKHRLNPTEHGSFEVGTEAEVRAWAKKQGVKGNDIGAMRARWNDEVVRPVLEQNTALAGPPPSKLSGPKTISGGPTRVPFNVGDRVRVKRSDLTGYREGVELTYLGQDPPGLLRFRESGTGRVVERTMSEGDVTAALEVSTAPPAGTPRYASDATGARTRASDAHTMVPIEKEVTQIVRTRHKVGDIVKGPEGEHWRVVESGEAGGRSTMEATEGVDVVTGPWSKLKLEAVPSNHPFSRNATMREPAPKGRRLPPGAAQRRPIQGAEGTVSPYPGYRVRVQSHTLPTEVEPVPRPKGKGGEPISNVLYRERVEKMAKQRNAKIPKEERQLGATDWKVEELPRDPDQAANETVYALVNDGPQVVKFGEWFQSGEPVPASVKNTVVVTKRQRFSKPRKPTEVPDEPDFVPNDKYLGTPGDRFLQEMYLWADGGAKNLTSNGMILYEKLLKYPLRIEIFKFKGQPPGAKKASARQEEFLGELLIETPADARWGSGTNALHMQQFLNKGATHARVTAAGSTKEVGLAPFTKERIEATRIKQERMKEAAAREAEEEARQSGSRVIMRRILRGEVKDRTAPPGATQKRPTAKARPAPPGAKAAPKKAPAKKRSPDDVEELSFEELMKESDL